MARKVKGESSTGTGTSGGGKGDDTYIVDDTGDTVKERRASGIDTVLASIDYTLGANVENLTLTGTADLTGTGNELDNVLIGNSGANSLYGLDGNDTLDGGAGDDLIDGGAGTDTAVFSGDYSRYSFEWRNGDLIVTSDSGETDTLRNIEYLSFADQTVSTTDISTASAAPALQAVNDAASVAEDGSVQIQVLDNDQGDGITISTVDYAGTGQLTVNADGSLTYSPDSDWNGQEIFSYTVTDSSGASATATVTIDVAAVNDAPIAANDTFIVDADTSLVSSESLLLNDRDLDGDMLAVTAYDTASAKGGTVQVNPDGSFIYTPAAGFTGTDSFTYTVSDGNGGSDTATVSLDVSQPGSLPYYISGLIYDNELKRLNNTSEVGTAVTVTYTFLDATPSYIPSDDPRNINDTFASFTEQQQQVTREALAEISAFTGITFVEVESAEAAVITLGIYDMGGSTLGAATYPGGNTAGNVYSDVWLDTQLAGTTFEPGTEGYYVLLHEIGHAIGLDHPSLVYGEENRQFTVMDYISHPTIATDVTGYQIYDIAALQYLYGANATATAGDDIYDFNSLNGQAESIWDAGGHDTIDMSAASFGVTLDLNDGAFSTVIASGTNNLSLAYGTVIEDAIGSAFNDSITGNDVANRIDGGGGDDVLAGGAGADVFVFNGNWGDDVISDYTVGEDALDFTATGLAFNDFTISETGGGTLLLYGSNSVLLEGVTGFDSGDLLVA